MRDNLATVRRIARVTPIDGADLIEAAWVDGWSVVIKKNEFHEGDLVIYCEIDSWIPHDLVPSLRKGKAPMLFGGVLGTRLKTVTIRGQISQGLLLPLSVLPDEARTLATQSMTADPSLSMIDVTSTLGITQWYNPEELRDVIPSVKSKTSEGGCFPVFIPKTDQPRVQNLGSSLNNWRNLGWVWEVSEKLDGSSMTVYLHQGSLGVCSRNLSKTETSDCRFWTTARAAGLLDVLTTFGKDIALQGELIGPKINNNRYRAANYMFYCFDIWDITEKTYWSSEQRIKFCKEHKVLHVPVLDTCHVLPAKTADIVQYASGPSALKPDVEREGLVFKCTSHPGKSFKAVSNVYLLQQK